MQRKHVDFEIPAFAELTHPPTDQNAYASSVLAAVPQAYWRAIGPEGVLTDVSGHGRHATSGTGASPAAPGPLYRNESSVIHFNGQATAYATPGNSLDQPTNDFSLLAWVRTTVTTTGNSNAVLIKKPTAAPTDPGFQLSANRDIRFRIADGQDVDMLHLAHAGVNDGQWHLIAAVCQRHDSLRLFIDGQLAETAPSDVTGDLTTDPTFHFGIGALVREPDPAVSTFHPFDGDLAEPAIFSVALPDAVIDGLYQLARGRFHLNSETS